ncbi:MAG: low molecular weight protein tyrosine phosphatase family protein [Limisphaerales bacterium]
MKLLFLCSRNRWRSPTAERLFDGVDGHQARSAGTEDGARIKVTAGLLGWADVIFVMERKHAARLVAKFPDALAGRPLVCLRIPDDYGFMDVALVALLHERVPPHLAALPDARRVAPDDDR